MDVLRAYALLRDACAALDTTGDHAAAAYIGHGMALLETKYGIDTEASRRSDIAEVPPPATALDRGNRA